MAIVNRREFLISTTAATLAASAARSLAAPAAQRVFLGSNTPNGILAFDWDLATATLTPAGLAAKLANVDWIILSKDRTVLFAASEVESFNGKSTGEVASYNLKDGKLSPRSARNSAGAGTCHIALDPSGRTLLSADYGAGSAASFLVEKGALSEPVWTQHFSGHGPVLDRQQSAHAHFASFSPDSRYCYFNDLGSDLIHIFSLDAKTAQLTPKGEYKARPGAGPRTLHFHPSGAVAYSINELDSTVDVLSWNKADGSLALQSRIDLLPAGSPPGVSRACDTVLSRDGRNVYFANRGDNFLYAFSASPATGALTPIGRTPTGGRTPRNFVLDPTERWMLVANQDSNRVSVFARDPKTGALATEGRSFDCPAPMCILFV